MKFRLPAIFFISMFLCSRTFAATLFIPMDSVSQANHLKAYGVAYAAMQKGITMDWLLNYKGGSFAMKYDAAMQQLCKQRGVTAVKIEDKEYTRIVKKIEAPGFNGRLVKLEKPPRIAVYTPPNKEPWDDAVTLALTYAQIPFDKLYAGEVLAGGLDKYDWLHLHHEDFTGQYGKFWAQYRSAPWYLQDQQTMEALAHAQGYTKVSQMQLAVVKQIRNFVAAGGNLFAMCSATESFDIALAADGVDICDVPFDGDPPDPFAQSKLNFTNCFAFDHFNIVTDPLVYSHSDIDDNIVLRHVPQADDYFTLIKAPAKLDPVPVMLCQNHSSRIKGFYGQTTAFRKQVIKPGVLVMGKGQVNIHLNNNDIAADYEAKYIHGEYQKGTWTFYGGHDPEAYQHKINDPVTDLSNYPNSPGYRLILNNVLFPSVKTDAVPIVTISGDKKTPAPTADKMPKAGNIRIYPNPANNELIISLAAPAAGDNTAMTKIKQVVVVSNAGKEVFSRQYDTDKVSVDTDSFPPGIYLIEVNGQYAGKVVKE